MATLILYLKRLVDLYLYYVGLGCLLSWVPNINPQYPLFHAIFLSTGFYLLPPFMGFIFAPLFVMIACVLVSQALEKLYKKITKEDELSGIMVYTPEEFFKSLEQEKDLLLKEKEKEKDKNNDSI